MSWREGANVGVGIGEAVTGHMVVNEVKVSVVTLPMRAGQSAIVGPQEVMV